jgi:hypothetical protein
MVSPPIRSVFAVRGADFLIVEATSGVGGRGPGGGADAGV